MNLVRKRLSIFPFWKIPISGVNLTAESNKGQLDAYIKNTQWDLIGNLPIFLRIGCFLWYFRIFCDE